jgi:hypothetical protein
MAVYEPNMSPSAWNKARLENPRIRTPTWEAIRVEALTEKYLRDLGRNLSEARRSLLRRAIMLQVVCEVADHAFLEGKSLDSDAYTKNTNTLRRMLMDLGLDRKTNSGVTDLSRYLASRVGNDSGEKVA